MQSYGDLFANNKLLALGLIFAVLVAVVLVALLLYRLTFGRRLSMSGGGRARQPRLGVVDAFDLDRQRQLVIVRRDNTEHLLMIGGPNDLVIETAIVRVVAPAAAAQTTRDKDVVAPAPNLVAPPVIPAISTQPAPASVAPAPPTLPAGAPIIRAAPPAPAPPLSTPPTLEVTSLAPAVVAPLSANPPLAAREPGPVSAPRSSLPTQPITRPVTPLPPRPNPAVPPADPAASRPPTPVPPRAPIRPLATPTRAPATILAPPRSPTVRDQGDVGASNDAPVRVEPSPLRKPDEASAAETPVAAVGDDKPTGDPAASAFKNRSEPAVSDRPGAPVELPPKPKPPMPPSFPLPAARSPSAPARSIEALESLEEEMAKLLGRPSAPPDRS